jgi:hypothetical protein
MKAKEIDINQFRSINELYSLIDANAYELERNWDILELWVNYRNLTVDEIEKQKMQIEIYCLQFDLKGNQLFSQIYSGQKSANEIKKYPDLNEFEKEAIVYVKERAIKAINPILKARYNHLLWKCPIGIKNNSYALNAIENYIKAINGFYEQYKIDKNKDIPIEIGRLYENLVAVSNDIKSENMELKSLTIFLLFQAKKLEFYTLHGILSDMLEYPKIFKPVDFENTLTIFEKELQNKQRKIDYHNLATYYLPTAIKIAIKTKNDVKKWHNEVGKAYLILAKDETEENRFWIKQSFQIKSLEAFTLAGNKEMKIELEKLYAELKPKITLPGFSNQIEIPQEHIIKVANNVLKEPANKIYEILASGYFFPPYKQIVEESNDKENSFLDYCTTILFDNNKNISKLQDEDINNKKIFETYNFYVSVSILPYLHHVFMPGIKSGHLNFENFIDFISKKTWIGIHHSKYDLGGEDRPTNWVGLLAPSIIEFFLQTQAWLNSKYYVPSYVLCIDSLTLKIEGLLRDFCNRLNIPTSVHRKDGMQEIYVNNILDNETIKKYFNEDDLIFLNYLFSNEGGINMRNNVAHCFYDYGDYNLSKMLLLIAALLRIGKYYYKEEAN